jgi:hypothetical protein
VRVLKGTQRADTECGQVKIEDGCRPHLKADLGRINDSTAHEGTQPAGGLSDRAKVDGNVTGLHSVPLCSPLVL